MGGFNVITGFFSTLLATLIGVLVAFWNDRQIDSAKKYHRALQHLQSVEKELERNRETVNHNVDVVSELQEDVGGDSSHYAIDILSDDSWEAALEDGIIDSIDDELYSELNEIYYQIHALNELIRRLRTESIHPSIGELEEDGVFEDEIWSITVTYWDDDADTVRETDLATVIKKRCNSLGIRIDGVDDQIKDEIERIENAKKKTENRSLKRLQ